MMDFIVWTRILAPLAIVIFVFYVIISANRLDKKITLRKVEAKIHAKTSVESQGFNKVQVDSFDNSLLLKEIAEKNDHRSNTDEIQEISEKVDKEIHKQNLAYKNSATIPPIPVNSTTKLPSKAMPVTSLLEMSNQTFRKGIILSEILGRPKSFRGRLYK